MHDAVPKTRLVGRSLKLSEQVARQILADVTERELTPGDSLPPEGVMLKEYGVSRGTLREALRILEVYGLLTLKPGPQGGPRIADVSTREFARTVTFYYQAVGATFAHLVETRLVLEPLIARQAARNCTAADAGVLQKMLERAKDASTKSERLRQAIEFHEMVAKISANPVLALVDGSTAEIFEMYSLNGLPREEDDLHLRAHQKIARLIAAGDEAGAEAAMRRHLNEFERDFYERNADVVANIVHWL